jgi:hypothetical protein
VSGTWAEVLDFLKGRVCWDSSIGAVNGEQAGAECEGMPKNVYKFLFERDYSKSYDHDSLATSYIQGYELNNPITAWINGDLVIPEDE